MGSINPWRAYSKQSRKKTFLDSFRHKAGPPLNSKASPSNPSQLDGRTYREELYAARRIPLARHQSPQFGLGRLNQLLWEEGIVDSVRAHREYIGPSARKGLERIQRSKGRFNIMVSRTIDEILKVRKRLS